MADTQYEDLLRLVLTSGTAKADRTGTGARSVFGHQLRTERAGSIAQALELAAEPLETAAPAAAWVIGGGEIYRAALGYATMLSVTEVDSTVDGDIYAPTPDPTWKVAEDKGWQSSTSGLRYRIRRYTR